MNEDFDKWLEKQDETVKVLISERFAKLEATVAATRQERDVFSKELKGIGKKLEKGSEADTLITELNGKLAKAEQKSSFLEKAQLEGCIRPSAAFALASSDNLFTETGEADWKKIREVVPELFKIKNTKTDAGSGTNQVVDAPDANAQIRAAAHKQ